MTDILYPEIRTANVAASGISNGMMTIEPTVDAGTAVKSLAYKDADGNVRRVLTTDSPSSGGTINASMGDSLTSGDGHPYTNFLNSKYSDKTFYNFGVGGEYATALVNKQLLQATGLLRWRFKESLYPFELTTITASITDETLAIEQPASGYLSLACLPIGQEVTISGNFQTATSSRLKIYSADTANILTTTSTGDFTVTYTPVADREELRVTTVSGTAADLVYVSELQIELTDRSGSADSNVYIWAGINDIIANVLHEPILEALLFCANQVSESGSTPYLFYVMPMGNASQYSVARELVRTKLNEGIANSGFNIVDTSATSYDGDIKTQYDWSDGLHLNQAGQIVIGESVDKFCLGRDTEKIKGYDAKTIGDAKIEGITTQTNNKKLSLKRFENLFNDTEDLDEWMGVRVTNNGASNLTGSADTGTHYKAVFYVTEAGTYVFECDVTVGDKTWLSVHNGSLTKSINLDITNKTVGTASAGMSAEFILTDEGKTRARVEMPTTAMNTQINIYAYVNNTTSSYTGDASTVDLTLERMQLYKGVLSDKFHYVANTDVIETGYQEWTTEEIDPTECGSKLKNVATGVYETIADNTEYYAENNIGGFGKTVYYQQFTGSSTDATETLIANPSGITQMVGYGGNVLDYSSGGNFAVPGGNGGTTTYIRIYNDSTSGLTLERGSGLRAIADVYKVWVKYTK